MENSKIVVFFTTPNGNVNQPIFTGLFTDPTGTQYPFALWKNTSHSGTVYFRGSLNEAKTENQADPVTPENIEALREYNADIQRENDKK